MGLPDAEHIGTTAVPRTGILWCIAHFTIRVAGRSFADGKNSFKFPRLMTYSLDAVSRINS